METIDCIIAGAGAVGLAIGRALVLAGREVLVIERNGDVGLETSSRSSEVIHAGLYYAPGSLKARLCREGRDLLVDYLASRHVDHRICGKLIVAATEQQEERLAQIEANALANGVTSLERLDRAAVLEREPELARTSGLFSPQTGIFDSRGYVQALRADMDAGGGTMALRTRVNAVRPQAKGFVVETIDENGQPFAIGCRTFINAAGLYASRLAATIEGVTWKHPETRYARGSYYQVEGPTPFRHLVYPVPEPGGLGIHLTLDLQGLARFGPDVEWIDSVDYRLDDHRREHFRQAIGRYWPGVADRALHPSYCGIRPKIVAQGAPDGDFLIAGPEVHGVKGLVQLFGIESPGLTASLAIARHVARLV